MTDNATFLNHLEDTLKSIEHDGLYKPEYQITSSQQVNIQVEGKGEVLNFCANNYLGLANDPRIIQAAHDALEQYGFGMASVRFICGTQDLHKQLEQTIAHFHGTEDTILYTSCFDANGGLFETILSAEDAIISDALNHASIIDGVRLCKAERHRYPNSDMQALEDTLKKTQHCRTRLIVTDGVFSMDGYIAKLDKITELAEQYDALVMIDDCHATGFLGKTGRGTPEHCGVMGKIDIITSTLGKALGGGSGGYTTGKKVIIDLLRQRSRPYLFSNTLPPPLVGAALKVFEILNHDTALRDQLETNTQYFRTAMTEAGFDIKPGTHPIVPVMLYDAKLAQKMAAQLLEEGIYVIGFFFPVVPKEQARIRVQISAAHTQAHLDQTIQAFKKVARNLEIL